MKTRNTISKLLTLTLAAALLCGTGLLLPVEAQTGNGSVKFISYASVGIVPGEKVRLSVGNAEESTGNITLSFSYYLAHGTNSSSSVPFYETEWKQVPRGESRFSQVTREDLKTEGEPGTGRARMIVRVTIIAPAGSSEDNFPGSLEVTADGDQEGESAQTVSKYRLIILAAKRSKQLIRMGVLPGQRLSFTFFNPKEAGSQPVRVSTYVYDSTGRLLSQTDPVELQPGQFYTASIDHDNLRVAGEDGTGLLQVRADTQVVLMDGSGRHVQIPLTIERVDNRTGSTNTGTYFTGTVTVSDDGF
jgi:hypothetical protein